MDWSKVKIMYDVISAILEVHRQLGVGLFEKSYKFALLHELRLRGYKAEEEQAIDIRYKGEVIKEAYQADIIVDDMLIIELKATEKLNKYHHAQLQNYMLLSGKPYGVLVNFHEMDILKGGISRKSLLEIEERCYAEN